MTVRTCLTTFLACLVCCFTCAAGLEKDLGKGLKYFRISEAGNEAVLTQSALAQERAIIDLRGTQGSESDILRLVDALKTPASGNNALRVLLLSARTPAPLREAATQPRPRLLTVGARDPSLKTDIVVSASAEEDQKAFQALENGTPLEKLMSSNPEKRRFDEAALAKTHANGTANGGGAPKDDQDAAPAVDVPDASPAAPADNTPPNSPSPAAPAAPTTPTAPAGPGGANGTNPAETKPAAEPSLHDRVLERAIQIQRALAPR